MNGVFNYNPANYNPSGIFYSKSKKGMVSWSGVLVAMAISLFIVAGLSFTLNIFNQKISHAKIPDSDSLVYMWLAKALSVSQADAVTVTSVKAMRLIQSASNLSLAKKGTTSFTIGFKNTGSSNWPSQGVSLRSSATRGSYLSHSSWISATVVKDSIQSAKPGELVYVTVIIEAPNTMGTYTDNFALYYSGQKILGTETPITIAVLGGVPDTQISSKPATLVSNVSSTVPAAVPVVSSNNTGTFSAMKLIQSASNLSIGQLQSADFQIGWKNTGTAIWKAGETPIRVRSSARTESYFRHPTWDDGVWATTLTSDVKPGEVVYTSFKLEAPTGIGNYNETFTLYRGSSPMVSAQVTLPIQVVKGAPKVQIAQEGNATPIVNTSTATIPTPTAVSGTAITNAITETEPTIRVGVFHSREPIKITANKSFEARNSQGQTLASIAQGSIATVTFDFVQKTYTLSTDAATTASPTYIRFVGTGSPVTGLPDQDTVFEIVSYIDHPGWSSTLNDNRFRSAVEVRYSESKDRVWLINDLSLESYIKGLGETSNKSPYEFQKSLIIAARTYAKIVMRTNKYPGENFNLRNTDADQVYRGYSSEIRMPQFAKAVDETRGIVVTYNGAIVVTPYYSNSDGRTRSWDEVWAGSAKPWLVSVADPFCAGLTLWGHGVGMSARGAVAMAAAGSTFDQILKHYYTGVQLTRMYQ